MRAKTINLRQWRKRRRRDEDRAAADQNAARHGQIGAARKLLEARAEKAARDLDGHKLDPDE